MKGWITVFEDNEATGKQDRQRKKAEVLSALVIAAALCAVALGMLACGAEDIPATDVQADDEEWNDFDGEPGLHWMFDSDTGTLTVASKDGSDHKMPDFSYDPTPWSEISEKIKAVETDEHVTSVGSYAFSACSNLESIYLPGATEIGKYGFFKTAIGVLDSSSMPQVTQIGASAFSVCRELITVDLPNVTVAGGYSFLECTYLKSVDLPNVSVVGSHAFTQCINMQHLNISGATSIGERAFWGCLTFMTLDLPNVTEIKEAAFANCASLKKINLASIEKIGEQAFGNYDFQFEKVYFGPNLTSIGVDAFYGTTFYDAKGENVLTDVGDLKGSLFVLNSDDKLVKKEKQPMYTITFDSDGGSEVSSITAFEGMPISEPADPVKEGYGFMGWTEDGEDYEFPEVMPGRDVHLVAKWAVLYPISIGEHVIVKTAEGARVHDGDQVPYGLELFVTAEKRLGASVKIYLDGNELTEGSFTVNGAAALTAEYTPIPSPVGPDDPDNPVYPDDSDDPVVPVPHSGGRAASSGTDAWKVVAVAVAAAAASMMAVFVVFRD